MLMVGMAIMATNIQMKNEVVESAEDNEVGEGFSEPKSCDHPLSYRFNRGLKRCEDIVISVLTLLLIWPFLIVIAVAVKASSPGPVFFRQKRQGINGKVFWIYKFRSMKVHKENEGTVTQAKENDDRVTRFGRIIRKTSLDELPQFFNVIKGEMSIVGPRPHAVEHDKYYERIIPRYNRRFLVKPGITGWAQVNNLRGETRAVDQMMRRAEHDLFYISKWSFLLDVKIILMTPFVLLSEKAY